jgi:hypothetical protein
MGQEYRVLALDPATAEEKLNELGNEGWILVTISDDFLRAVLRRTEQ